VLGGGERGQRARRAWRGSFDEPCGSSTAVNSCSRFVARKTVGLRIKVAARGTAVSLQLQVRAHIARPFSKEYNLPPGVVNTASKKRTAAWSERASRGKGRCFLLSRGIQANTNSNTDTVQFFRHRSSCRTRRHQVASASVRLGGAAHTQAAERRRRVGLRVVHVVDERLEMRSRGLQVVGQQAYWILAADYIPTN
jgi:hypothetical protein